MSSTANGPDRWRALHVHLPHSIQTAYLSDVVAPVLRATDGVGQFFFLRYWQGGPHVRLRLLDAPDATVAAVAAALADGVPPLTPELTDEYAYEAGLQSTLADLEGETPAALRPAGTVEPATYVPETGKYGGAAGVAIAERLFCATSAAVLDVLGARPGGELRAPIGEALRVMAMSLRGSGLGIAESRAFLARYETFWRRYVPPGHDGPWPGLYEKTRAGVGTLCRAVWQDGRADAFHAIYAEAGAAARQADLVGAEYGRCLANYVHTTNNRMGMIPAGEAFLAHVLGRSLGELAAA